MSDKQNEALRELALRELARRDLKTFFSPFLIFKMML